MKQLTILLSCYFYFFPAHAQSTNKRMLQPSDLYRLQHVSSPQVSPDGKWVAYVVSSVDTSKDKRNTKLWMISWDGKESVELTNGPGNENNPKWSPDGKYLSFLSARKEAEEKTEAGAQLWIMDRRGGEAKRITNIKGEIEAYDWSPDGKKVLLTIKDHDLSDSAKTKVRTPYVIDRYHFKQDYIGYLDRRSSHLYLYHADTHILDTLTRGIFDETNATWSPDGERIAFVSNQTTDPDKNENSDIYLMEPKSGSAMKKLTTWPGSDRDPHWSPDGKWIAYLQSSSNENFTMYGEELLAVISANGGTPTLLSKSVDRPVHNPRWAKDGKSVAVLMEDDRKENIVSFSVKEGSKNIIADGNKTFTALEINNADNEWVVLMTDPQTPEEIYALSNQGLRRLTHVQDSFLAPLKLATVEGFTSKSSDGAVVSGILYRPDNLLNRQKLPLILFIHGGPVGQDNFSFDMDRQMYAAAGYLVAGVNYRGSSGRGIEYTKAIYGDWGHKEVLDIVGAANYLIQQGLADEAHMGIAGWSYGGISTNYTIATDQRFKAAVSGAGSSLQLSMYGVDQYITQYENELGAPWKNQEKWIALSYPFFHADRIKTPTLFMASQNDFNVPVAGAEQMYQALKS
ncbi:MAG TPA: S9 family peptidase, partial [Flavisolibacter sp.]|nr:S9 family peptidase [Flavisolibacter sp.]